MSSSFMAAKASLSSSSGAGASGYSTFSPSFLSSDIGSFFGGSSFSFLGGGALKIASVSDLSKFKWAMTPSIP